MAPSTATRPRTSRGLAARQRIVETAANLIFERGITATTLDDVREATQTSKSQLYHYFEDKADLVQAVIDFQTDKVLDAQRPLLDSLDSWENLHAWAEMFVRLHAERPCSGGCPIGSLAAEIVDKDEQARLDLVHAFDRWQSYLRRGFRTLQARGELRADADVEAITTAILAAIEGGLLLSQTRRDTNAVRFALDAALHYAESFRVRLPQSGLDSPK